jgi:hypothetical protein
MQLINVSARNLTAVVAELINHGGNDIGCWIGRERECVLRLHRDRAIYIKRKGIAPDPGSARVRAWATELATFHRFATAAGLCLENEWGEAQCEAGWYAARCALNHQQTLVIRDGDAVEAS